MAFCVLLDHSSNYVSSRQPITPTYCLPHSSCARGYGGRLRAFVGGRSGGFPSIQGTIFAQQPVTRSQGAVGRHGDRSKFRDREALFSDRASSILRELTCIYQLQSHAYLHVTGSIACPGRRRGGEDFNCGEKKEGGLAGSSNGGARTTSSFGTYFPRPILGTAWYVPTFILHIPTSTPAACT